MGIKQHFLEQLQPEVIPDTEDRYRSIPLKSLGILTEEEKQALKKAKFHTISDLAYLWTEAVKLANEIGVNSEKLHNLIATARLITSSGEQRQERRVDHQHGPGFFKVVVAGLDNSGKTSIITYMTHLLVKEDLEQRLDALNPTMGLKRHQLTIGGIPIFFWELGGQETFRQQYLQRPENYFLETDQIIFVVDFMARERLEESLDYLSSLLKTLHFLQLSPPTRVFLHKVDPATVLDPAEVETTSSRVEDMFANYGIKTTIHLTSVYGDEIRFLFGLTLGSFLPVKNWVDRALAVSNERSGALYACLLSYPVAVFLGAYDNQPQEQQYDWSAEVSRVLPYLNINQTGVANLAWTSPFGHYEGYVLVVLGLVLDEKEFIYGACFRSRLDAMSIDKSKLKEQLQNELSELVELFDFIRPRQSK